MSSSPEAKLMAKAKSDCPELVTSIQRTEGRESDRRTEQEEVRRLRKQDVLQDLKSECTKMEKQLKVDTEFLDRVNSFSLQDEDKDLEADLAKRCEKLWWSFYKEEVKAHKALETARIMHKQELSRAGKSAPLPPNKPSGPMGQKTLRMATQQDTKIRVNQKTVKRVLELLCDEMCFLIQSDTLAALAPLDKEQETLLKSDLILSAIGVHCEEDLYDLVDFILNYRKHGREQEKDSVKASGEQGEMEEEPSDLINPNDILPAVKEFNAQYCRPR